MYVMWNAWWWLVWLVPLLVIILWAVFGSSGPSYRYGRYGRRHRYAYGEADDAWVERHRSSPGGKHRNRAPRNYRRSDARIQEDVCDRLMLDDQLDPSDMEVHVENGVVSLTGSVASRFEKRLAEQIADSAAGVTDIDNQLRIGKGDVALPSPSTVATAAGTERKSSQPH